MRRPPPAAAPTEDPAPPRPTARGFRLTDSDVGEALPLTFSESSPEESEVGSADPPAVQSNAVSDVAFVEASPEDATYAPDLNQTSDVAFVEASPEEDEYEPEGARPAPPPRREPPRPAPPPAAPAAEERPRPVTRRTGRPGQAGFGVCRVCGVKNPPEATACGRCGEILPPAVPDDRDRSGVAPGSAVRGVPREAPGPLDPAVLPGSVRERFATRRQERQEELRASAQRQASRDRRLIVGGAFLLAVTGWGVSMLSLPNLGALISLAGDVLLGAAAGRALSRQGSVLAGQVRFGGAALLSSAIKAIVGLQLQPGLSLLPLFAGGAFALLVAVVVGGMLGGLAGDHGLDPEL